MTIDKHTKNLLKRSSHKFFVLGNNLKINETYSNIRQLHLPWKYKNIAFLCENNLSIIFSNVLLKKQKKHYLKNENGVYFSA